MFIILLWDCAQDQTSFELTTSSLQNANSTRGLKSRYSISNLCSMAPVIEVPQLVHSALRIYGIMFTFMLPSFLTNASGFFLTEISTKGRNLEVRKFSVHLTINQCTLVWRLRYISQLSAGRSSDGFKLEVLEDFLVVSDFFSSFQWPRS